MGTGENHVYFDPWVGKNYQSGGMFSKRVLILGEAHYEWREERHEKKIPLEKSLTRDCILLQIEEEGFRVELKPFFTKIANTFLNPSDKLSIEEKREFWHSVVFHNFIQESAGFWSRVRPTDSMWENGCPAFHEVLSKYRPQFIAVFGYELWNHLPEFDSVGPVVANVPEGGDGQTGFYAYPQGKALAFCLKHPSGRGFSSREWNTSLVQALDVAPND